MHCLNCGPIPTEGEAEPMNVADFIRGISFRYVQPDAVIPIEAAYASDAVFQFNNTVVPEDEKRIQSLIWSIWPTPKMSTFAIAAILNKAVSAMPAGSAYLNVGTWYGFTYFAGLVGNPDKLCIGVDNFSLFNGPRDPFMHQFYLIRSMHHHFCEMDYVEYFQQIHTAPIGCYLVDGPHDYHNQLLGLELAAPYLADGCIIIVDDTNWPEPRQATLDFINKYPGKYELLLDRSTSRNFHPTYWNGIMVFQKIG